MLSGRKECWMELCELAAQEKDPARLMILIKETAADPVTENSGKKAS
jgi:hypothetical protein